MKRLLIFSLFLFSFSSYAQAPSKRSSEVIDRVVAVVNEEVITKSQLDERINTIKKTAPPGVTLPSEAVLRQKVLDEEINKTLQFQIAKKLNLKPSDEEVNAVIQEIAERNHLTVSQMKGKLAEEGMSYDHYVKEIHDELLLRKLQQQELVPLIQISPQEVHDYLQHPPPKVAQQGRYHLVDYFIELPEHPTAQQQQQAENLAQQAVEAARAGRSVSGQVKIIDLDWRKQAELPTLFQPVVTTLAVGEVALPLRAPNGLHIVKLVAVEAEKTPVIQETHVKKILLKEDALNDASHIKNRLLQIRSRIAAGGRFADFAKSISQDPQSSVEGGDLGWVRPGMMAPEVEAVLSNLHPGEMSQPIKTQQGWVIIYVEGRRPVQDKQALAEAFAREALFKRKIEEKLKEWLKKVRSESYIKVETV